MLKFCRANKPPPPACQSQNKPGPRKAKSRYGGKALRIFFRSKWRHRERSAEMRMRSSSLRIPEGGDVIQVINPLSDTSRARVTARNNLRSRTGLARK
jgi:hypothetical protein